MLIAETYGNFAATLRHDEIPATVRRHATYLILDAVGVALAASRQAFADATLAGLGLFGGGQGVVIGRQERLEVRDAAIANGVLIHGLDFDDTHPEGVIHSTASCLPAALGTALHAGAGGKDFLTAFIAGTEVAARLGMVAKGAFHEAGFHPAGTLSPFSAALIAGRIYGLTPDQLAVAQGIALSTGSSSSRQFNREGSGTKRLHPGWGAAAGMTAAALSRTGFTGPRAVYEGEYGLFPIHIGGRYEPDQMKTATASLGQVWETLNVAFKPIPACLHLHAVVDAALALSRAASIDWDDVESICALLPKQAFPVICEPIAPRRRPANAYSAQTSLPYAVAAALVRQSFTLRDLEQKALTDPAVLAVADKVTYAADPDSGYPKYFSGSLIVRFKNGRELAHHEPINRGCAERPLSFDEVTKKFHENALLATSSTRAAQIEAAILEVDGASDLSWLAHAVAGDARS